MSESKKNNRKPSIIVIIVGILLIFASLFFGYLMSSPIVAVIGMAIGAVMVGATGLTDELNWLMGANSNIDRDNPSRGSRKTKVMDDIEDRLFGELEEDDIFHDE